GSEHTDIAFSLNRLARVYEAQSKYQDAERLRLRELDIREKGLGKEHQETAATLYALAKLYQAQNNYERAASYYQRALASRRKRQAWSILIPSRRSPTTLPSCAQWAARARPQGWKLVSSKYKCGMLYIARKVSSYYPLPR
ncbi:MAG TPA: tetratricopeptide repeat protein, partial [Ktedonobacteraceae bacterium]|nr:tetratricopeptide repeat protein [Ktedonobacteraceae bacterium]